MAAPIPPSINEALCLRRNAGALRVLRAPLGGIDLCSNDYLGLARLLSSHPTILSGGGATGSRLISGNHQEHEALESFLAAFHQAPAALLFGSGYEANLGLLGSLGRRGDTIIYDELCHASMRDGIRLSAARSFSFRHNDLTDLRRKMAHAKGDIFLAVESVYSMDGDEAPLESLCLIARESGAALIVDEAHSTGVYGPKGEGLVQQLGLSSEVFARVHTFGKALGFRGAAVVGPHVLREYLVNFARPFMYSTAPDTASLRGIRQAYERQSQMTSERAALQENIRAFKSLAARFPELRFLQSNSPIQGVLVPGNAAVLEAERALEGAGFSARAIRAPTVPLGSERIRICIHAFNSREELEQAVAIVASVAQLAMREAHGA